jgi:hypothetical protein
MLEREVEAYLRKVVQAAGGQAYKWRSSTGGVADRVVCLPGGQTWFVEVKTAGGRLSPLQNIFGNAMARLEQNYVVLWSKEDIDQWLSETIKIENFK